MTHLSLFSGIGGIDLAAHWAGFSSIAFVERDPFCQKILTKNFPGIPIHDDITKFNGTDCRGVDLVSAGFPCQPHSLAGKRLASGDERDLWSEVVRVLGEAQPRWFLGENVPGLLSSESGRFFGRVVNDLAALGFSVGWCVFGASDIGAVHRRNRVFIVAYNSQFSGNVSNVERLSIGCEGQTGGCDGKTLFAYSNNSVREGWKFGNEYDGCSQSQLHVSTANPNRFAGYETDSTTDSIGSERNAWNDVSRSHWRPIRGGDWRTWGIEPVIRRGDDGFTGRVDRLRALGNAVVPQQVYPILKAIKEQNQG